MKTGWTVIAVLVLGGWFALYLVGSGAERSEATANARRRFISAVYADGIRERVELVTHRPYERPGTVSVRDAERLYIEACRTCAAAVECERDRLVIAAGRSSDTYNPCER